MGWRFSNTCYYASFHKSLLLCHKPHELLSLPSLTQHKSFIGFVDSICRLYTVPMALVRIGKGVGRITLRFSPES